ncbi:MAG: hypothetical protein JNM94_06835 [Phycisphaerae bacterium]|nr:hypothetical protein [Phycisphaerae bacterium]
MRDRGVMEAFEEWLWSGEVCPRADVATVAAWVTELSDLYTVERGVLASEQGADRHRAAKILYFLLSDAPKVGLALDACALRDPAFAECRRILDVGCGVGATSVGALAWLATQRRPAGPLEIVGIDHARGGLPAWGTIVAAFAERAGIPVRLTTRCDAACNVEPQQGDLVLCQTALNESLGANDRHDATTTDTVARWARVAPTLIIEPALRTTTRALQRLRDEICRRGEARVVAPCPHQLPCPMLAREGDWCHVARRLEPSPRVAAVQAITRRRDDRTLLSYMAFAPRADSDRESDAVTPIARLVGEPLGSRGKTERFACMGDGSLRCLRVLDRERTELNAPLVDAANGALVTFAALPATDRMGRDERIRTLD